MMNSLTDDQVIKLAKDLQGSCQSIEIHLYSLFGIDDINIITLRQCGLLDDIVFNCTSCGWWCETGDFSENEDDDLVCSNCGNE